MRLIKRGFHLESEAIAQNPKALMNRKKTARSARSKPFHFQNRAIHRAAKTGRF